MAFDLHLLFKLVAVCLTCIAVVRGAFPQNDYTIEWTLVSSNTTTALVDGSTIDLGVCVCDLTANKCDMNCWCDSDCTTTNLGWFSAWLPTGPQNSTTVTCVNWNVYDRINVKDGMTVYTAPLGEVLCVEVDNNPSQGNYFTTSSTVASTKLDTQIASSSSYYQTLTASRSPNTTSTFKVDELIPAAILSGGAAVPLLSSYFRLPNTDNSGFCNDNNFATFFVNQGPNSCSREVVLNTDCTGILNPDYWVTSLLIGKSPSASYSSTSNFVTPTTSSATSRSSANVDTVLSTVPTTSTLTAGATCICANALKEIVYNVTVSTSGAISAVSVTSVLQDVSAATCTATTTVSQRYTVNFQLASDPSTVRARSGNPGYQFGLPVLVGTLTTISGSSAISEKKSGLAVVGVGNDGSCLASYQNDILNWQKSPVVTFGQNFVAGCVYSADLTTLQSSCSTSFTSTPILDTSSSSTSAFTHVGAFGNADPHKINDWIALSVTAPSSPTWNSATGTCSGFITGLHYQFLVADYGKVNNPQHRIVVAKAVYSTSDIVFRQLSSTSTQAIALTVTATFVTLPDPSVTEYVLTAPPVLPTLPGDIFYPFTILSASSNVQPLFVLTLSLAVVSIVFTVVWQ
eukprot:GILK01004147.1.p1 GENE.GILK01004147.1~~GILK01004147.1.p1  ORF type:complete len:641 (+),score=49.60 GILK01004147.1:38-1924(+)